MNGIVREFNPKRGFGFITPLIGKPNGTQSVYFHATAIRPIDGRPHGIPRGAEVRFILVRGEKGPQAADVEVVELSGKSLEREPEIRASRG